MTTRDESKEFPTDFLKIEDLYLWDTKLERYQEFQKGIHEGGTHAQSRRALKFEMLEAESTEGEHVALLRALVTLGVRIVFPSEEGEAPLHSLEATFAVEYRVLGDLPEEKMPEFLNFNCVHNVWPFWREHVYNTFKKASLPSIVVPFFPAQKGKPKKKLAKQVK
jgi:hypothetical protein